MGLALLLSAADLSQYRIDTSMRNLADLSEQNWGLL